MTRYFLPSVGAGTPTHKCGKPLDYKQISKSEFDKLKEGNTPAVSHGICPACMAELLADLEKFKESEAE